MLEALQMALTGLKATADDGVRTLIRLAKWRAEDVGMLKTAAALDDALKVARGEGVRK